MVNAIPQSTKVLVVGGGPAGSTAATLLARNGIDVTLFEQDFFPRYHIGESLLPSVLQVFDLMGARELLDSSGFQYKQGAFLEWGRERWPLNFGELSGSRTYSYQVVRSEFDKMLLDYARSQGAFAYEGVEVRSLGFDPDGRPNRAAWIEKSKDGGPARQGEISFDYLVDASGRWGIMANHVLKNRRFHRVFQNVAIWGYWENADRLATGREGDIAVGSIDEGWIWAIPLHDGTMSVGVVMHKDALSARKGTAIEEIYCEALERSPLIKRVLEPAKLVSDLKTESDYSYASDQFSGRGYFMCGDAACFLDPLLSSGVHLATFSAVLAAASISSIEAGEVTEDEASNFFEKSYRQAYLRFLVFLSAFYDINRGRESYFWEAQQLSPEDADSENLVQAFLKLVTGLRDYSDAKSDTHRYLLDTMSHRIDENLSFRRDKDSLASLDGQDLEKARENARFFSSVEGMFSLNEDEAIDGLYVAEQPRLHLARVR